MTGPAATQLSNGDTVGGYRIVGRLGKGSMGSVYQAVQLSMQRLVALKVLAPELADDQRFVERFLREARLAANIGSVHVVSVHDAGIDDGVLFISMELAEGGDLVRQAKELGGALSAERVAQVMRDCARGLVAVHRAGMIHRDIKPANLFTDAEGICKLGDLGLARDLTDLNRISNTGLVVGTPAYMSPEQAKAETDVDIRSDIFSLGASCFRLLTGTDPFPGSRLSSIMDKIIGTVASDSDEALERVSAPELAAVIRRCMQRERSERFQDPADLVQALDELIDGEAIQTTDGEVGKATAANKPGTGRAARANGSLRAARVRRRRYSRLIQWTVLIALSVLALLIAWQKYL